MTTLITAAKETIIRGAGRKLNDKRHEVSSLKSQLDGALDSIRRLVGRMESSEHNLALRKIVLSGIEECVRQQQISTSDGTLLKEITDNAPRRHDEISGGTDCNGYELCARL